MAKYELAILTDRDRSDLGTWYNNIFEAKNDLEALIYVSFMYEPQGKVYNEEIEKDEENFYNYLRQLYMVDKEDALSKAKSLLKCIDPSDYYDNVAFIKNIETKKNIYEDQCFIDLFNNAIESLFEEEYE